MRVRDEAQWAQQLVDFANDPVQPFATEFKDFVVAWAEAAEELCKNWWTMHENEFTPAGVDWEPMTAIDGLRNTLRYVEAKQGRLTVGFLGQALVLLATHWEPAGTPEDFAAAMTTIEQNLYADVAVVKLAELEKAAQRDGN